MRIVPSADIGDMLLQQGEAAVFNWKWYYSVPGMIIWLVLIAALVLPKSNRNINVLAIWFPITVLSLLWSLFVKITSMPSSAANPYSTIFQSMLIGIAVLWLMADYIGKFRGLVRFLVSMAVMVIISCLGILSYSASFSEETVIFLALFVFMTFAILMAIAISRRLCSKKYSPVRFMLWLALWMILFGVFATLGFYIAVTLVTSSSLPSDLLSTLLWIAIMGLILGVFIYLLNLPYMILGFVNPFFRERFYACLWLKPVTAIADSKQEKVKPDQANQSM